MSVPHKLGEYINLGGSYKLRVKVRRMVHKLGEYTNEVWICTLCTWVATAHKLGEYTLRW